MISKNLTSFKFQILDNDGTPKPEATPASSYVTVVASNVTRGNIHPFVVEGNVSFGYYVWNLDNYFTLNNVDSDEKKVRLLMNLIGDAGEKIRNSFLPQDPTEFTYKQIVERCNKLFLGERNEMVESFKFNTTNQKEDEDIFQYSITLQVLADQSNFGEFRDRALRDRFVAGVKSQDIREQCLKLGSSAKFGQTVKLASKIELVSKHARLMQNASGAGYQLYMTPLPVPGNRHVKWAESEIFQIFLADFVLHFMS